MCGVQYLIKDVLKNKPIDIEAADGAFGTPGYHCVLYPNVLGIRHAIYHPDLTNVLLVSTTRYSLEKDKRGRNGVFHQDGVDNSYLLSPDRSTKLKQVVRDGLPFFSVRFPGTP